MVDNNTLQKIAAIVIEIKLFISLIYFNQPTSIRLHLAARLCLEFVSSTSMRKTVF